MHVLLPPSEAKTSGGRGRPLGRRAAHPTLGVHRAEALAALAALVAGPRDAAAEALLLPAATVDDALAANRAVDTSPTRPALERYAGVVYDGLDVAALSPAERAVAERSVLVMSGLFGVVTGGEAVPAYRVPAKAVLPGLGVMGTWWRPRLDTVLPGLLGGSGGGSGAVVDLRSSDYAAMWRVPAALAERTVEVVVHSPLPRGGWGVVSFASKHAKGRLAAALVRRAAAGEPVSGVDDVAAGWIEADGLDAEPLPRRGGRPHRLVLRTRTSRAPGAPGSSTPS